MSSKKDDDNENNKTLISSKDENENENEIMNQTKKYIIIKNLNDTLDEIIDKSKSFEAQLKSIKKQKI